MNRLFYVPRSYIYYYTSRVLFYCCCTMNTTAHSAETSEKNKAADTIPVRVVHSLRPTAHRLQTCNKKRISHPHAHIILTRCYEKYDVYTYRIDSSSWLVLIVGLRFDRLLFAKCVSWVTSKAWTSFLYRGASTTTCSIKSTKTMEYGRTVEVVVRVQDEAAKLEQLCCSESSLFE